MVRSSALRSVVALAVLALVAGCSGGSGSPSASPAPAVSPSDAAVPDPAVIRSGLVALWVGDDESPEDTATGTCFADALAGSATPDELRDVGILDPSYVVDPGLTDLSREGAGLWVDAQLACSDFITESVRAQVAATKGKVDRAAYESCLRAAVTEEQLREVAVSSLLGDLSSDAVAAFSTAQLDCVRAALPVD